MYGEVTTPYELIDEILDGIPEELYKARKQWLDVGAGRGYFGERALARSKDLDLKFSEVNPEHIALLKWWYGSRRVLGGDFLQETGEYDVIIGNPPYVVDGAKKVPTKDGVDKRNDGRTAWTDFVEHSLSLLVDGGYLGMVVPSLWLRHDKAGMHEKLLKYRLVRLRCYNASEASKLFRGHAQTPVVAFVLQKVPSEEEQTVKMFCGAAQAYTHHLIRGGEVLPTACPTLVSKFQRLREKVGGLRFSKTNMPPARVSLGVESGPYENIRTVKLDGLIPRTVIERSTEKLAWADVPKLVLGHKMYGLPFVDEAGKYGISSRDNYVIAKVDFPNLEQLRSFMETRVVRCLFSCFRYRMRYLEREALECLFDPTACSQLPQEIDDASLSEFLELTDSEKAYVERNSGRDYARTQN